MVVPQWLSNLSQHFSRRHFALVGVATGLLLTVGVFAAPWLKGLTNPPVHAAADLADCDVTWTGADSDLWNNVLNWDTGVIPTSSDIVCFNSTSGFNATLTGASVTLAGLQMFDQGGSVDHIVVGTTQLTVTGNAIFEDGGLENINGIVSVGGNLEMTGGIMDLEGTSQLIIQGTTYISSGTHNLVTFSPVGAGAIYFGNDASDTTTLVNLSADWSQVTGVYVTGNFTVDAGDITGPDEFSAGDDVTIDGATWTATPHSLHTVSGDFTVQDGSNVQLGSATVDLAESSGSIVLVDGSTLAASTGDWTVHGDLTTTGSSTLTMSEGEITLNGDLDVSDSTTFDSNTGTVIFEGASNEIRGSITFHNLEKTVSTASTLILESGEIYTIANDLTLNGAASNLLTLRASTSGSVAQLFLNDPEEFEYMSIQDMDSSGGDLAYCLVGCTDAGGNNAVLFELLAGWDTADQTLEESAGVLTLNPELEEGDAYPFGDLGFTISLTGSTATEGSDFTLSTLTPTLIAEQTQIPITLTLLDDAEEENAETIVLTLTAVDAPAQLGTSVVLTLTIAANDTVASSGGGSQGTGYSHGLHTGSGSSSSRSSDRGSESSSSSGASEETRSSDGSAHDSDGQNHEVTTDAETGITETVNHMNFEGSDAATVSRKKFVEWAWIASGRSLNGARSYWIAAVDAKVVSKGQPDRAITRAEALKVALGAFDHSPANTSSTAFFTDLEEGAWYLGWVARAKVLGIVRGYADGSLHPNELLTGQQGRVILERLSAL